jgi:penicillin amidase
MTFKHVLGVIKPLDKVLNIGPFPAAGSLTTINNAQFNFIHLYESSLGPSMRMICDLSQKHILSIVTGGVSGQPFSPHYSDQTPLWRNGGYIDITMDPADIPQAGWTKVVFEK